MEDLAHAQTDIVVGRGLQHQFPTCTEKATAFFKRKPGALFGLWMFSSRTFETHPLRILLEASGGSTVSVSCCQSYFVGARLRSSSVVSVSQTLVPHKKSCRHSDSEVYHWEVDFHIKKLNSKRHAFQLHSFSFMSQTAAAGPFFFIPSFAQDRLGEVQQKA